MPIELRREFYKNRNSKNSLVKKFEFTYIDDVREGPSIWWYENGIILIQEEYRKGLLNGIARYQHSDGSWDRLFSNKNDLRNGPFISFSFQKRILR